jgi:hypothetical protein
VVGGHDDIAIFGRMWWNRFRMSESGLFVVEYRSAMVGCRWTLFRCLLRWIPLVACRVEVVNMSMKSGMARVRGSKIPRPPALMLSCVMRRA